MFEVWIILALISAIFTGIKEVMSKKVLNDKVKPNQIIFFEYLMLFLLVSIIFFKDINFLSILQIWDLFLIKSLSLFLFNYFFFKLLEIHEISLISPLNNLSPVFLIVLSSVFLNEVITFLQFLGILIIIFATYFLEMNLHHNHKSLPHKIHFDKLKKLDWKTIGVIFLMLFSISICAMIDKMILMDNTVFTDMFFTSIIILSSVLAYSIKNKKLKNNFKLLRKEPMLLVISLFSNLSTYFILMAVAIPGALVSLVIPIKRTSTLFSSLFGGILFHENHLIKKIISILIMLIGVLLISL